VGWASVHPAWEELYHYAWFLSFAVAFTVYTALAALRSAVRTRASLA
jgi:cytosine/uracil/thiamine/allantoin permease